MLRVRHAAFGLLAGLLGAWPGAAAGEPALVVEMELAGPADVIVELEVEDGAPLDAPFAVTAATLMVDGTADSEVLLLPGSGRDRYDALVGPLGAGRHALSVVRSELWPADARVRWKRLSARAVKAGEPDHERLRHAPRLWLRADTVGEATDVPLLAFVEEDAVAGGRRLRYSLVFSNEDGGTPSKALMARWGRTTDIELAYEVVLGPDGSPISELFQGPDHEMRPFRGRRVGAHPILLDAAINHIFLDRGRSGALVALVPVPQAADAATRESITDSRPWIARATARELALEGKLTPGRGQKREMVVDDPREYLYLEARLRLESAAVAARAGRADGTSVSSHGGDARLAIERDGLVRTAIPLGTSVAPLSSLRWECAPRGRRGKRARCQIEALRAFRLDEAYRPGPNLLVPASLDLRGRQSGAVELVP
jgi:hypothetical protein